MIIQIDCIYKKFFSPIILCFIILCGIGTSAFAQDINADDTKIDLEFQLQKLIAESLFDDALQVVYQLQKADTLSWQAMESCADCLIILKKYQECIDLMDNWCIRFPNKDVRELLDYKYGEAYYYLGNFELAWKNLAPYIKWIDDNGFDQSLYYLGLYANALHYDHHYSEADKFYARYFNEAVIKEDLPLDQLDKGKGNYSNKFYCYAYNCIFQGDETKGKELLELSRKCGGSFATFDLLQLIFSSTFAASFQLDKKNIKEFEEIIAKYDPKQRMGWSDAFDQETFWSFVKDNSEDNQKLQAALQKDKRPKFLTKAIEDIYGSSSDMSNYLALCRPYEKGDFVNALEITLFGEKSPIKDFRIYPAKEANAFATPYGQIYLTEGLALRYNYNESLLMGVCAHEATHYLCQHALISKWQSAEREKKNAIIGGVLAGLAVTAMAVSGMSAASNGASLDDSWADNVSKMGAYIIEGFDKDAYYFKFKYSRSQELEADIVAYRFCEMIGIGGYAYIMALQLLGDDLYMKADSTDDHPTTKYRVLLLKYLFSKDHPEQIQEQ